MVGTLFHFEDRGLKEGFNMLKGESKIRNLLDERILAGECCRSPEQLWEVYIFLHIYLGVLPRLR